MPLKLSARNRRPNSHSAANSDGMRRFSRTWTRQQQQEQQQATRHMHDTRLRDKTLCPGKRSPTSLQAFRTMSTRFDRSAKRPGNFSCVTKPSMRARTLGTSLNSTT
jgi:hypothetical protein